jgi:K+-sensing histidine kinase KdpD
VDIEVRDHGVGIAAENLSRIFDEFVQLESTREQGTGLGLPISRRLAVLLGGRLSVQSTPGVGSSFVLSLPQTLEDGTRTFADSAPKPAKEVNRRSKLSGVMLKDAAREEATS